MAGDDAANGDVWHLVEGHRRHLLQMSLRLMRGNVEDAEDALSIAVLKVIKAVPQLAGRLDDERAWLSRVVSNVCMDLYRERRRWPHEAGVAADLVPDASPGPEAAALSAELGRCAANAIEELPDRLREPFLLRARDELSYGEIGDLLGITPTNCRKRVQHARDRVRRALHEVSIGPP